MSSRVETPSPDQNPGSNPESVEELGHPKGTLAIVLIYGALFALGWCLLYFVEFIPRGAPQ